MNLCRALEKIEEVANYLNEKKREVENIEKMIELKNRFIEQKVTFRNFKLNVFFLIPTFITLRMKNFLFL